MTPADRLAMIRAAHRRYLARVALVERVALRIEATIDAGDCADPADALAALLWSEPTVRERATGAS